MLTPFPLSSRPKRQLISEQHLTSWATRLFCASTLFAFALLWQPAAHAQINFIWGQAPQNGCGENNANAINIGTSNATVNAGGALILEVNTYPPGNPVSVAGLVDNYGAMGDTWAEAAGAHGSDANAGDVQIFYSLNIVAATDGASISITAPSSVTFIGACLFEVDGLATSGALDCAAPLDTTSAQTTLLSAPCAISEPNEFIVAASAVATTVGNPPTASEGGVTFTPIGTNGMGGNPTGYYISSTQGTLTAGLNQSSPGTGVVAIASFIGAGQSSPPPQLDIYGGYAAFSCTDPNSYWVVDKINGHFFICDPASPVWFGKQVDVADNYQCDPDQFGKTCDSYALAKYGTQAAWANETAGQLLSWGMNGNMQYPNAYIWATATDSSYPGDNSIPNKMVFGQIIRPCLYGARMNNTSGDWDPALTSPIKDVTNAMSPLFANNYFYPRGGRPTCDFDDPAYVSELNWILNNDHDLGASLSSPYHLYLNSFTVEDTDETWGYNGGYDFSTTPAGFNQPLISMIVALGSPVQTGNDSLGNFYGVTDAVYADYFVHQHLTWMNQLIGEYGNVAALNAAWATSGYYTTFGTSGTCYGSSAHYSSMTCAASGSAISTTGSGAGPYSATLPAQVSRFSVAVWVGSTMICGDDGGYAVPSFSPTGNLVSASNQTFQCASGNINYQTGSATFTLNATPNATPVIEYIQNGWGIGTGIMDEDGYHGGSNSWWGTCPYSGWPQPAGGCDLANYGGNMNATLVADLKKFEETIAGNWLSQDRAAVKAKAPWVLFVGAAQMSWGTVPDCQILQEMAKYSDLDVGVDPPATQAMLDFAQSCGGDMPWEYGNYTFTNPDSDLGYTGVAATHSGTTVTITSPVPTLFDTSSAFVVSGCADATFDTPSAGVRFSSVGGGSPPTTATYTLATAPSGSSTTGCTAYFYGDGPSYASQSARGSAFSSAINNVLSAAFTASGTKMYVGYDWWQLYDNYGERTAFGLLSEKGNAYDGHEDVTGAVSCSGVLSAYACGGEVQNYGDVISSVRSANSQIDSTVMSFNH